jgi:Fur family ferric uptake transcriptional regulator
MAGTRTTAARRLLAQALARSPLPRTAAELLAEVRRHSPVHKTTVYRNLDELVELGEVAAVSFNDGVARYESAVRPHHHHVVCTACRRVEDVQVDEAALARAQQLLARRTEFAIKFHCLEFFGLCRSCRG